MTKERENHSISNFQEDWLVDEHYKTWIRKVPDKPKKAYCILCSKSIDVGSSGASALESHRRGKGHDEKMKERSKNQIGSFFNKPSSSSDVEEVEAPTSSKAQSKIPYDIKDDTVDAEILWCLNLVKTHQSYRSCEPVAKLFKRMFKTDPVAQQFKMKKDKARYYIIYGIFPTFQATVIKNIHKSKFFSVSFDESFNHHRQMCQMDVNIRYWNEIKNIAETTYLTSRFLLRPNAENLKDEMLAGIEMLEKSKFIHLSMDGPNTNWNVLQLLDDALESGGFSRTLNIGSCTLHILHGAFGTAILYTEWKLGKLMKASHV